MSIFNFLFKQFRRPKGSSSETYVSKISYSETLKRFINLLDRLSDASNDFIQIVFRITQMQGTRKEFQQLDFGSVHDAYRLIGFMEAGLNLVELQILDTIQFEFRHREEILQHEALFTELTTLALTKDQKTELFNFEQIHKDDYLSRARTQREKNILAGIESKKHILISEHDIHILEMQQEQDKLALAQKQNAQFKELGQSTQKQHYHRKIQQFPELSSSYMNELQWALDSIKTLRNGEGTHEELSSLEREKENANSSK
jgi:hypothetical protein